jgi:hypothetical protein
MKEMKEMKAHPRIFLQKWGEKYPRKTLVFWHFACRGQNKCVPLQHEKHKERERENRVESDRRRGVKTLNPKL